MPRELDPRRGQGAVELLNALVSVAAAMDTGTQVQLGATVFASMVLGRSRMPALLAVFTAVGFGYAAKRGYVVVHDVHQAALAMIEAVEDGAPGEDRPA